MFRLYTLIKWTIIFKLEKKRMIMAADFHRVFQTEEETRDKEVGKALLGAEQADEKLKVVKKLFIEWIKK